VELDNSQTEICGVELEVEWSLWSGAEVFGVEKFRVIAPGNNSTAVTNSLSLFSKG
jgi:hypothetical protein